uniref:Uncharacterized protein n=1 Tax=Cacopsylla melanoneura TaxID=428564 RepID=A0A8D8UD63_9HEMI
MAEGTIVFTSLCLFALLLSVCARPNDPFITFRHADTAPVEDESLPNEDPATLNEEVLHNTKNPTYNEDELEGESNPLSRRQTETAQEASETTTSDAVNDAQNQVNEESTQTIDAGNNQLSDGINAVSTLASDASNQLNEASTQGNQLQDQVSGQISNGVNDIATQASEGINQASEGINKDSNQASEGISTSINKGIDAITDQVSTVSGQLSNQAKQMTDQAQQGVDTVSAQIGQGFNGQRPHIPGFNGQRPQIPGFNGQLPQIPGFNGQLPKFPGFNGQLPPLPAGLGPQGFNGQLPPMPPNMGPQQIQQLREFLSLEVNNKDKFGEIFARMTPEQVKKIREIVLQVGQQTGNQELIRFGQCQSPQFDQKAIQVLLGLGQATYDRLNAGTTGAVDFLTRSGPNNIASNVDQRQVFDQIKRQIGAEQDFIRRLVNMIELQLSRAPQIDNEEFAEIKQITARIKQLSGQVQSQLQQATDMSQLSQLGNTLLEIQRLSSKIQQKISAELLEEKMKELSNASSIADQTTTTSANNDGSADNAAVQVQTTETK